MGTIPDILMELAKKAGEDKDKDIDIGYEYETGKRIGGEWEFHVPDFTPLNASDNTFLCYLELSYWLAPNGCLGDESKLTLSFPLSEEERQKVIDEVSTMIENIKVKVQSDTE